MPRLGRRWRRRGGGGAARRGGRSWAPTSRSLVPAAAWRRRASSLGQATGVEAGLRAGSRRRLLAAARGGDGGGSRRRGRGWCEAARGDGYGVRWRRGGSDAAPINKSFFMLVGIKLSNLSREQKNLKDKRKFFNQICRVPYLQHSAKLLLCRVPGGGTRQTLDAVSHLTGGARRARVLGTCAVFAECRRVSTRQK